MYIEKDGCTRRMAGANKSWQQKTKDGRSTQKQKKATRTENASGYGKRMTESNLLFAFRQKQVEEYRQDKGHGDTVLGKDALDNVGEDGKDLRHSSEAQANTEREGDNQHVTLTETAFGHHLETGKDNGTEHDDGATTQNALGHGGKQ